jgi:hypothetical protein
MNKIQLCAAMVLLCGSTLSARDQLTNLPTVYIDTDVTSPTFNKTDYVDGSITVVSDNDKECTTETRMGIRGRGNSTWNMPKKPWRVKFDKKINFLNLNAKAKNWVMLANYADKTLMRNAVAFEISNFIGMEYTPSVKFVDVVLNGEYLGNYMVTDQTEVKEGRVPVEEQEVTVTTEPDLTGGYLVEIDGFASSELVWFQTPKGMPVTIKYPKDDEINDAQREYITNYIDAFEALLFSDDFTNATTGYRSMVDETSLVNWYIACELTGNSDSFWSTYIYKKRNDEKLYFGPLWDFDIAFNNDCRLGDAVAKLMRRYGHSYRTWIQRLWQDSWFRSAVSSRWNEIVEAGIEQHLLDYIDETATLLDQSQQKNFTKWNILNKQVYVEQFLFQTYQGGVDYLKKYVTDRVEFLTNSFAADDPSQQAVTVNQGQVYHIMHSSGKYMGHNDLRCIITDEANADNIKFTAVADSPNVYNIMLADGVYLASDDLWTSQLVSDPTGNEFAQFSFAKSNDAGYVGIYNIGREKYLGTDGNDIGNEVYTDKALDRVKSEWKVKALVDISALLEAQAETEATLATAATGDAAGEYPEWAVSDLKEAYTASLPHIGATEQADVDAAAQMLYDALSLFKTNANAIAPDSATWYNLYNDTSGLLLSVTPDGEATITATDSNNSKFQFTASATEHNVYSIATSAEGHYLGHNGDASLIVATEPMEFEFEPVDSQLFRIKKYGEWGYIGPDAINEGSPVYANMGDHDMRYWALRETSAPDNFDNISLNRATALSLNARGNRLNVSSPAVCTVKIYNTLGRCMATATLAGSGSLNIGNLPAGVYVATAVGNHSITEIKFTIIH